MASRHSKPQEKDVRIPLGPEARYGSVENIYAIFNDRSCYRHVRPSNRCPCYWCFLKVKGVRDKVSPYDPIVAAQGVGKNCHNFCIASLHIKLGGTGCPIGRHKNKNSRCGAQCALRILVRSSLDISCIEDVTPVPLDSPRRKGARRDKRV